MISEERIRALASKAGFDRDVTIIGERVVDVAQLTRGTFFVKPVVDERFFARDICIMRRFADLIEEELKSTAHLTT